MQLCHLQHTPLSGWGIPSCETHPKLGFSPVHSSCFFLLHTLRHCKWASSSSLFLLHNAPFQATVKLLPLVDRTTHLSPPWIWSQLQGSLVYKDFTDMLGNLNLVLTPPNCGCHSCSGSWRVSECQTLWPNFSCLAQRPTGFSVAHPPWSSSPFSLFYVRAFSLVLYPNLYSFV